MAVAIAAAVSFAASEPGAATLAGVLALLVAATIAEALPVPIEGVTAGRTSLATVFMVAAAALDGWAAATLVGVLSMAAVEAATRKPVSRVRLQQRRLCAPGAAAGGGGRARSATARWPRSCWARCSAAAAFYAVNIVPALAAWSRGRPGGAWLTLLRGFVVQTAVPLAVMASVAAVLVVVWESSAFAAAPARAAADGASPSTSGACTARSSSSVSSTG